MPKVTQLSGIGGISVELRKCDISIHHVITIRQSYLVEISKVESLLPDNSQIH